MLGAVLGARRDQIVLATKFGNERVDMGYGPAAGAKGGRAYIRRAVEQSLRRLRTDYLDLYQLHTPDAVTPVAETLHALSELVTEGKVRYLGHSNFSGWQIADAAHLAREAGTQAFISAQNHWSLLERQAEAEVVPAARAFRPGGAAVLPARQRAAHREGPAWPGPATGQQAGQPGGLHHRVQKLDRVEALARWAAEHGVSLLDVAIGGLAAQPGCASVIAGATSPDQVKANAAAAEWIPSQDALAELNQLVPVPDPAS